MWPVRLCAQHGDGSATGTEERPDERPAIEAVAAEGAIRELERDDEDTGIGWWLRAHCFIKVVGTS